VNALGSDSILQYPRYKLNAYVLAISFVAATGGLLFGAARLAPAHRQLACESKQV